MAGNAYIKSLDGVRAFAVVLVMSLHAGVTWFGWIGVQLFFVLSGFLITGILWKDKAAEGSLSFKLKKFWVRRSLRIFPLYFFYLLGLGIVYICLHYPEGYTRYLPYLLTYTFNFTRGFSGWHWYPAFTHFWSLCIEEQFYLFFPLIVLLSPRRLIRILMVITIVLTPLIRYALGQHFIDLGFRGDALLDAVYWHPLSHLDAFFLGGIIPVLSLDRRIRKPQIILGIAVTITLLTGMAEFLTHRAGRSYFTDLGYRIGESSDYEYVWEYSCLNLLFASLILVLVSLPLRERFVRFRSFLESGWLVSIGRVSYGMYIFHWLIWTFLFKPFADPRGYAVKLLLFLPYVLAVYLVATLSFRYFETVFIRLKDRLFPRPDIAEKEKAELGGKGYAENSLGV